MGNQSSSLPAELPEDFIKEVLDGKNPLTKRPSKAGCSKPSCRLPEEKIQEIVSEVMDGSSKRHKTRKSRKPRRSTDTAPGLEKSAAGTPRRKQAPLGRSVTDSEIDSKWKRRGKDAIDPRSEMDPHKVIELLERYSEVDQELADCFLKSLQGRSMDAPKGVPKAA